MDERNKKESSGRSNKNRPISTIEGAQSFTEVNQTKETNNIKQRTEDGAYEPVKD